MPEYWFDHIHLNSPDPVKSAEFYEQMFGAILVSKSDKGDGRAIVKLDLKGIIILISQQTGEGAQTGLIHFGIRTDKLDEAVPLMKERGVKFTKDIIQIRPSFKISFLSAPEGVSIELQEGQF